jgi:hypothetical protein
MTRRPRDSARHVTAFAATLLAVTLNVLLPLAHAVSMRDGAPGSLWSVLCSSAAAEPGSADRDTGSGPAAESHDCCLGLAHAPALAAPPAAFTSLPPIEPALPSSLPAALRPAVAIRDGPTRPRGPPSLV